MKKIEVLCEIAGNKVSYPVYIGRPTPGLHWFRYQAAWLTEALQAKILDSKVGRENFLQAGDHPEGDEG
jgi:hypothetical protein